MADEFSPGRQVRILTAPDRIGVLEKQVGGSEGNPRWLVRFSDGSQRLRQRSLEIITGLETVDTDIEDGRFGRVESLQLAITHSRLTGRLADVVYSMEATNTEFFSYQFKPVLNFLDSPSNGILIADEVGLGKTIEAGLIWTELAAREDARRLLIVCPAVLREKWQIELKKRFGVTASLESAQGVLSKLKQVVAGDESDFALVTSMQGLRPPRDWDDSKNLRSSAELARFMEERADDLPIFDLVVVDEAHYMRNDTSQTHELGRILRRVAENMVFLSATPVHLRSNDLFNLLNILDAENFPYSAAFDDVLDANGPLIRLADYLRKGGCNRDDLLEGISLASSHYLLKGNRQLSDVVSLIRSSDDRELASPSFRVRIADRLDKVNLLAKVVSRTRKRDVQGRRVVRDPVALDVHMTDTETEFYQLVTQEVRSYCLANNLPEGFMVCTPQRQMCSSMPAALQSWLARADSEVSEEEFEPDVIDSPEQENRKGTGALIQKLADIAVANNILKDLEAVDSKYECLRSQLSSYFSENAKEKVIIFSYFRGTLRYLKTRLEADGYQPMLLMGGMKVSKTDFVTEFRDSMNRQILLASEVLSEGVDLQFCSTLINYDLPWNPMRVEQRIGRIDRIGQQKSKINIWNLFYADTLDDRIYNRLFDRLDIFRNALGDLEAVLGDRIQKLSSHLLGHILSEDQEKEQISQTAGAIEQLRLQSEHLEEEAVQLHAYSDYILQRVDAARELKRYVRPQDLWVYTKTFLQEKYPGCKLAIESAQPLSVKVELSNAAKVSLSHFMDSSRSKYPTKLFRDSTGSKTRYIFENRVDFGQQGIEVVNQSHPLVRWISSELTAGEKLGGNVVAVTLADKFAAASLSHGVYFFVVKLWSFFGARTSERLVYGLYSLETGELVSDEQAEITVISAMTDGESWMSAGGTTETAKLRLARDKVEDFLDDAFEEELGLVQNQNHDRVDQLQRSLVSKTQRQIASIRKAIETLRSRGRLNLVPAQEGRIRKANERRDLEIEKLEARRQISGEPRDVIAGLVKIHG